MPKNAKKKKNNKNRHTVVEQRKLVEANLESQVYGILEKTLGSRYFTVNCMDNVVRRCRVRNKRMKVKDGDICIIALRDFDENNADIIYKYNDDEVRILQKEGIIPTDNSIGYKSTMDADTDTIEDSFIFEDL